MRTRLMNYRPLLFIFVGMLLGIFFVSSVIAGDRVKIVVVLTIFAGTNCVAMFRKDTKTLVKGLLIFALSFVMAICFMLGLVGKTLKTFDQFGLESEVVTISGRVESENSKRVKLSNIEYDGATHKNIKMILYAPSGKVLDFEIGSVITVQAKVEKESLVDNGELNTQLLLHHIYFSGNIYSIEQVETPSQSVFESIKLKTDKLLEENMSQDAYGVSKALLFGDKWEIESEVYDSYKLSGLAHILSISGLHVGFVVALISFILKKCKANPVVEFTVLGVVLTFYCLLCGLASSVIRASIMSLVLISSTLFDRRRDKISNLSLAGIIILLLNPAYALDVGFQLSFLAVLGIMLFCSPITNGLRRIKLPEFLASGIAVTLSAEIFTLPVIAKTFGYIAPISLISNLVIIPVFSLVFCVLFLAMWFNLIFSFGGLYFVLGKAISVLNSVAHILSQVGVIAISKFGTIGTVSYYSCLCLNTKYFVCKKQAKQILSLIFALIFVLCMAFAV